jgi:hypothetical protein
MRLFRLWTRDELVQAIRDIESAIASGAQSVSYTGGGSVGYAQGSEMRRVLASLYDRLDELDGTPKAPRVRHVRVYQSGKGL